MPKRRTLTVFKLASALLIALGIADAGGILKRGSFFELMIFPYIWIIGAMILTVCFGIEDERLRKLRFGNKKTKIELEGQRVKSFMNFWS